MCVSDTKPFAMEALGTLPAHLMHKAVHCRSAPLSSSVSLEQIGLIIPSNSESNYFKGALILNQASK